VVRANQFAQVRGDGLTRLMLPMSKKTLSRQNRGGHSEAERAAIVAAYGTGRGDPGSPETRSKSGTFR